MCVAGSEGGRGRSSLRLCLMKENGRDGGESTLFHFSLLLWHLSPQPEECENKKTEGEKTQIDKKTEGENTQIRAAHSSEPIWNKGFLTSGNCFDHRRNTIKCPQVRENRKQDERSHPILYNWENCSYGPVWALSSPANCRTQKYRYIQNWLNKCRRKMCAGILIKNVPSLVLSVFQLRIAEGFSNL